MVVVVMMFMVVVMLVALHYLCQASFVQQYTGQVPHMLFLHHRSWSCQRAQGPVALALLGSLLVLAVRGCGLVRWGLGGWCRRRRNATASHHPATDLGMRRAIVGLGRAEGMFP